MDTNNMNDKLQKYDEFRNKRWTLELVKTMTLDKYTNATHNSFTYDVEYWTKELGSIRGRSAFKFGIYKRKSYLKEGIYGQYIYKGDYAWLKKYGDNKDVVFKKILDDIKKVIEYAQDGKYDKLEDKDIYLDNMFKWKIAFLYQKSNNIMVTPIYKYDVLKFGVERINKYKENMSRFEMYEALYDKENFQDIGEAIQFSEYLWEDYPKKIII